MTGSEVIEGLSGLPEEIVGQITSLLMNQELMGKEAILLSLVSKEFFRAIQRRRCLSFDHEVIYRDADLSCADHWKRYKEELDYLLSTLTRYENQNVQLDSFTFKTDVSCESMDAYYQCVKLAFKRSLRRLDISMNENFSIPRVVSRIHSLEELRLSGCRLRVGGAQWPNLKRLTLELVLMGDRVFEGVIRGCPNIEDLKIRYCAWEYPEYNFQVSDCRSLKRLSIQLCRHQTFELNAVPALECLACSYGSFRDNLIDMSYSDYQNLRSLSLEFSRIRDDFFSNFAAKFPLLEELSIKYNRTLKRISVSSPAIKKIELVEAEALQEAHFDVPKIVIFKYESPRNDQNMMIPSLSFSGASGRWISCVKLVECNANVDAFWFMKLSEFLTALYRSKILVTVLFKGPAFFNESHRMIADSFSVPEVLGGIRDFCIETSWPQFSLTYARVVLDGIFWFCRPQSITFRHLGSNVSDTEDPPIFQHSINFSCDVTAKETLRYRSVRVDGSGMYGLDDGQDLQLPPTSQCDIFLELLEAHREEEKFTVVFSMEY